MRGGYNVTRHLFSPGALALELDFGQENPLDTLIGQGNVNSTEQYIYLEDEFELSPRLKVNAGLHLSGLSVQDTSTPACSDASRSIGNWRRAGR